jgi:hypothetical protein
MKQILKYNSRFPINISTIATGKYDNTIYGSLGKLGEWFFS